MSRERSATLKGQKRGAEKILQSLAKKFCQMPMGISVILHVPKVDLRPTEPQNVFEKIIQERTGFSLLQSKLRTFYTTPTFFKAV